MNKAFIKKVFKLSWQVVLGTIGAFKRFFTLEEPMISDEAKKLFRNPETKKQILDGLANGEKEITVQLDGKTYIIE